MYFQPPPITTTPLLFYFLFSLLSPFFPRFLWTGRGAEEGEGLHFRDDTQEEISELSRRLLTDRKGSN